MKKFRLLQALVISCFSISTQVEAYTCPDWNEFPITFDVENTQFTEYSTEFSYSTYSGNGATLSAVVDVDQDATFVYDCGAGNLGGSYELHGEFSVFLDEELYQRVNIWEAATLNRYYIKLTKGEHQIKWVFSNSRGTASYRAKLSNIGVQTTPTITVNLLEPGSLGTEVRYQTDHVKNVKRLVVKGKMNNDDWSTIYMMTNLFSLDLTDSELTEISSNRLSYRSHNNLSFFHEVKLPKTLKTIGYRAFFKTDLDEITFPETLTEIGEYNQEIKGETNVVAFFYQAQKKGSGSHV